MKSMRVGSLSPDDKKRVLRDIMRKKGALVPAGEVPRCVVCTLPLAEVDDTGVPRCPQGHKQRYEDPVPAGYGVTAPVSPTPHRAVMRSPTRSTAQRQNQVALSGGGGGGGSTPASYQDLSRQVEHTVRCYITPDVVAKAVKKQMHRTNAKLSEAESLTLRCSGPGERFVRIENLGGLTALRSLTMQNHSFAKIEGLQPLTSLTHLDLSGNRLQKVEGISHLVRLREINLNGNFIESIPSEGAWPKQLAVLRAAGNRIASLDDLHHLRHLLNLEVLDLRDNAICVSSSYRSIAAYAALSVAVLDEVEVTDTERNAAIYHWDRKGLKPLQFELSDTKRELEALKQELEDLKATSSHKDGQLNAVSKLLEMSHTESDAVRREKQRVEDALQAQERQAATLQSNLLHTRSDLEFLKLELETIHPDISKSVIEKCSDTLGGARADTLVPRHTGGTSPSPSAATAAAAASTIPHEEPPSPLYQAPTAYSDPISPLSSMPSPPAQRQVAQPAGMRRSTTASGRGSPPPSPRQQMKQQQQQQQQQQHLQHHYPEASERSYSSSHQQQQQHQQQQHHQLSRSVPSTRRSSPPTSPRGVHPSGGGGGGSRGYRPLPPPASPAAPTPHRSHSDVGPEMQSRLIHSSYNSPYPERRNDAVDGSAVIGPGGGNASSFEVHYREETPPPQQQQQQYLRHSTSAIPMGMPGVDAPYTASPALSGHPLPSTAPMEQQGKRFAAEEAREMGMGQHRTAAPRTPPSAMPQPVGVGVGGVAGLDEEEQSLQGKFSRYVAKALHCEKCGLAYQRKREVALEKCSSEHLLGMLQEKYPDFQARFTEDAVVEMAQEQLLHYLERITVYTEKQEECEATCAKFLRKARALIPLMQ